MPASDILRELNLDRYDRNARLQPALLLLLPLFLFVAVWLPEVWTMAGTLVSILVASGVTFFLAQVARRSGSRLETKLGDQVGREYSARLLCHEDDRLPSEQKERLQAFLKQHGRRVPTLEEEREDPDKTRAAWLSAVKWLLEITRSQADKSLLLNENIAYGFWRNLLALKAAALTVLVIVLGCDAFFMYRRGQADPHFLLGAALAVFCLAAIATWVIVVRKQAVLDASRAYADRLFSQVDNPAVVKELAIVGAPSRESPSVPQGEEKATPR
ncbi:MAG: hypothetical protein QOI38_2098 [Sphingomonadales bacterium]|jgi:hypothetical protein|nr:hypothetical protein [Sphingomonadales bacterium]